MTNKSTLATIPIGNKLISVNSLALLIRYSSAISNQDNLFVDFVDSVDSVSSKYQMNIPVTIIFNEPTNYNQFIETVQLEHSPELLAAYEFCYVELKKQPALLNLIKKITDMLWRGDLKKENLCCYLHDSVQSV
jgi:hypothetical protein